MEESASYGGVNPIRVPLSGLSHVVPASVPVGPLLVGSSPPAGRMRECSLAWSGGQVPAPGSTTRSALEALAAPSLTLAVPLVGASMAGAPC